MHDTWSAVDAYFNAAVADDARALEFIIEGSTNAGLPAIAVSAAQGKLLALLAKSIHARRILEVGTLGGYSAAWLARALPPGGRVVSLELDAHHAQVARANLQRAGNGIGDRVEIVVGPALETLGRLSRSAPDHFDFVFIDADKPSNADYFSLSVPMTRPGGIIIVDNVVRDGAVVDASSNDPGVRGVRRLVETVAADKRVSATVVQTVGSKGYDGFLMAVVQ